MNLRPVSLLAVLATVLGVISGCSAGSGPSIAPNVRGTVSGPVAGPVEGGAGIVPAPETPAPVAAAGGSDVLGPRADGERFPTELFSVEALYGENYQTSIPWGQSAFANGIVVDASGRLTLPLFVRYAMRANEARSFDWIEAPGMQVRIVHVFGDAEGNKHYHYCDALTTGKKPDGSNVLFSDLDLHQGGVLSFFMKDPRTESAVPTSDFSAVLADLPAGQTYHTLTSGYVDLGGLFLMQTLTLPGLKPQPAGDGLFHILETPEEATIDTSRIPNIPIDLRFRFPDSSR